MRRDLLGDESDVHLRELIDDSWDEYRRQKCEAYVVTPAMPILFFGDIRRYFMSPIRIVTVGRNPSRAEFPGEDRFARFPQGYDLESEQRDRVFHRRYLAALSAYFHVAPYMNWFDSYEYVLHGLEASYRDSERNTVLHTDLCSALATDPTWGNLSPIQHASLEVHGMAQWHRLIAYLAPDVVLASVAQGLLNAVGFPSTSMWEAVYTIPRDNPYHVRAKRLRLAEKKETHLIFGRAAEKPFGTVSRVDREKIGIGIREYLNGE